MPSPGASFNPNQRPKMKTVQDYIRTIPDFPHEGIMFRDVTTLFFPQPSYPSGWWTATLAGKRDFAGRFREADARNRHFVTSYYNADIHRAAFTPPEFFRHALD